MQVFNQDMHATQSQLPYIYGYGSKRETLGTAGFGLFFVLQNRFFRYPVFLTHSHMFQKNKNTDFVARKIIGVTEAPENLKLRLNFQLCRLLPWIGAMRGEKELSWSHRNLNKNALSIIKLGYIQRKSNEDLKNIQQTNSKCQEV